MSTNNLIEMIKKYIGKFFSDFHNVILGVVVASIIVSVGGIYSLYDLSLSLIKNILLSSTPLWATLSFVLVLLVYFYVKTKNNPSRNQVVITKLFDVMDLKWKVKYKGKSILHFDKNPFCPIHDTRMMIFKDGYLCPIDNCGFSTKHEDIAIVIRAAENIIESIILKEK